LKYILHTTKISNEKQPSYHISFSEMTIRYRASMMPYLPCSVSTLIFKNNNRKMPNRIFTEKEKAQAFPFGPYGIDLWECCYWYY